MFEGMCIGGPMDGMWLASSGEVHKCIQAPKAIATFPLTESLYQEYMTVTVYVHRSIFNTGVWLENSLTSAAAVDRLVKGYRFGLASSPETKERLRAAIVHELDDLLRGFTHPLLAVERVLDQIIESDRSRKDA